MNNSGKGGQGQKTKANGGGSQVVTQKQQVQQQQQQKKKNVKKVPNKPPPRSKDGVRIDAEVEDKYNIQNEQNEKWQCPKCKYVNENTFEECQKCVHLQKLKEEQKQQDQQQNN